MSEGIESDGGGEGLVSAQKAAFYIVNETIFCLVTTQCVILCLHVFFE